MTRRRVSPVSCSSPSRRILSVAVVSALLGTPLLAVAQVTPDTNAGAHRPGTGAAANGVPVVNIVAPSAAGVSHNQYQQFNVDKQGLILNNAAGVSATQLGGYIVGNPNYQAGQSAKLIINEVTSTNPTYLRGYTEVAGNAADVVVSNPNGISVNGGGFINTNHATLTTGTPVFGGDGSLSALHVTSGNISIDGDGLNATGIDRLDLISRSLTVNGKVWANNLNVVTGANQVGYADLSTQTIAGDGDAPSVSVDVAALGGMYANKIMLVGTEAGLGVRNAGELATQSGDFTIDAAGQLQLTGTTSSAANLTLDGASLNNSGTLQSDGAMRLQTAGDTTNTGTVYSAGDLTLDAGGALSNSSVIAAANDATLRAQQLTSNGTLGAGVAGDGSLQGNGALSIDTLGTLAAHGSNLAGGAITLQGGALDLSGAQTRAAGAIALTSTAGDITNASAMLATSGALTVRSAGSVDNSGGSIQAGALDAQAQGDWRNAYGSVQTQSAMTVQLGGLLDNTQGTWVSAGDAAIRAASLDNSTGTLYATDHLLLDTEGLLSSNNGAVYAGHGLDLSAGQLDTSGTLRSDGTQTIQVEGDASVAGTSFAGGAAQWQVGGTFTSAGTLAAQGDLSVAAGNLLASGILAAGLQADGSLSGSAQLAVTTQGLLTATGQNVAAVGLQLTGSALDLHGATTRAGGDITLNATQGDINHAGGDLATNGRLAIQAAQAFNNTQGHVQAAQLAMQTNSLSNAQGQLLQTGTGDTTLHVNGAWDNSNGQFASNAVNLNLFAGSLDNTGGAIEHAGTGALTLTTGALTNSAGQIVSNGSLVLTGTTIANQGGTVSVSGDITLSGDQLDNTGGTVVAQNILATLTGSLGNTGGLLQANALQLSASTLDNGNGQIKALNGHLDLTIAQTLSNATGGFLGSNQAVNLNAGSLDNAGQIYAGSDLTVDAQGDLINKGALQAQGNVSANVGGVLANDNGQLEAGSGQGTASLLLNAAAISNQAGRIANADSGGTTVSSTTLDNTGGTLGGQGDVVLHAAQLTNTSGTLVSGGNLILQSSYIGNQNGTLYSAGNTSWNNSAATLDNSNGGSVDAGGEIALTLDTLHNNGGDIAANGNVTSQFNTFDGIGRLRAGNDLWLTLSGDYTNQAGNTLFANGDFIFNLGGAFTNASGATLQSVGTLNLHAASLDNQDGADIYSAATTLIASGNQTNAGRIEGDTVTLGASDITNTGTVIGNAITLNANNLTNGADLGNQVDNTPYQTALIAAVNQLNLYVTGELLNRDAMLYTLGDLTIAADPDGMRTNTVTNRSGDIEAGGDIFIATNQFTNQRRVFDTRIYTLTPDEQAQNTYTTTLARYLWNDTNPEHLPPYVDASQVVDSGELATAKAFCDGLNAATDNQRCAGYPFGNGSPNTFQGVYTSTLTSITQITATSAESRLLAGGNITLNGSVLNDKSTIAAGNNLVINGQDGNNGGGAHGTDTVQNVAWVPTGTVVTTINEQSATQQLVESPHREWIDGPWMSYGSQTLTDTLALGNGQIPGWITYAVGAGADAHMSAGNAVDISAQDINNTVVGSDGRPVSGVGLGQNGAGQTLIGSGAGNVGRVGGGADTGSLGAIGPAPGAQIIGTPQQPYPVQLPGGGLYTIHPGSGSAYLIETDPRFASYGGFLGSDYLLNQLGLGGDDVLKRLGDAFYETQLVMDQITSLTGKRYLTNDTDALEQYKALMDAGAQEAQQFNLAVGVALTPAQMASLTQDMVWLVSEQVDGQSVLVPVVYLSQNTANSVASGAVIQGTTVTLNASNQLANTGAIQSTNDASLQASNLLNAGHISAGGDLSVRTAQDLLNVGAIQGGNVALVAGNNLASSANIGALSGLNLGMDLGNLTAPTLGVPTGGTITALGTLTAQAGNNLTLDHATISAGQNLGLAAGNDLNATASTLSAGNNAQLIAGNNLTLNAAGSTQRQGTQMNGVETTTHTVTTVTAGGSTVLAAGNDLTSQGAQVSAGDQLALSAGHDVTLNAVTDSTTHSTQGFDGNTLVTRAQVDQQLQGTTLSGTNGVAISAGNDLNATAGTISATQGDVALAAGDDVNLIAGNETHTQSQDTRTSSGNILGHESTTTHDAISDTYAIGTQIGGNTISVAAGNDLNAQAAYLDANNALTLAAGNNVNLTDAHDLHSEEHDVEHASFSFFSTSSKRFGSIDPEWRSNSSSVQISQSSSVGNVFSGDSVTVAAGNNLTATNAQIVGTHDVTLTAGNNLTLNAGQNSYDVIQNQNTSHTGLMNNGGLSVLIGNRSTGDGYTEHDTTYSGSTVGSLNGNVTLSAGNDVHITGSDVLSQTGTAIVGNTVTIDAAVGTSDTRQTHNVSQGGINVGIGGGVADAVNGAIYSVQRGSQVQDSRLSALYAVQAGYQASDAITMSKGGLLNPANKTSNPNGINLQVGIGGSSAGGTTTTHDDIAYGSHISSQGNVTIAATGGDLTILGSQVSGQDVALAAANNLNLQSQAENHTLQSTNSNVSGGVGLQIGSDGIGFYAQASGGEGKAHGNGITHADTTVNANGTLTLISGNDTTIQGAQLTGQQVIGAIGNNLLIQSEQDTDDYASQQWQAGGKVVIGYGSGGSLSYNQSKTDSHYQSVNDVSGIQAGDGGFQLAVGNNTHLIGGVIGSSADPSNNLLNTGSLTYENLHNEANYSASSVGVSANYSAGGGFGGAPILGVPQKGNSRSDTNSGIAQGTIIVRDNPNQDLGDLDRNPTLGNQALKPIFDAQKVQENMELGQVAGYVGMRTAGTLASYMADHASSDAERASWSDGGTNKILLHGLVGAATAALGGGNAVQGALGAAASEAASKAMSDYLISQKIDPYSAEGKSLMALASTAMGGAVGGVAGATTALHGELYNRQLHPEEITLAKKLADESGGLYTQDQIEDAMRMSGNKTLKETALDGLLVNSNDANSIYDMSANWGVEKSPSGNQTFLMQLLPTQISPDLANYITANTGGNYSPYSWTYDQQGLRAPQEPYIPYLAVIPDYVSVTGAAFGLSGSVALNMHTGQIYAGGSGTNDVVPGFGFSAGYLPTNLGETSVNSANNTRDLLTGAGGGITGCYILCAGFNYAYGGNAAIEIGAGISAPSKGASVSTGLMHSLFKLPFTSGDKKEN